MVCSFSDDSKVWVHILCVFSSSKVGPRRYCYFFTGVGFSFAGSFDLGWLYLLLWVFLSVLSAFVSFQMEFGWLYCSSREGGIPL